MKVSLFVPKPNSESCSGILRASGIVGSCAHKDLRGYVVIDYEGDLYKRSRARSWEDMVRQAADRHECRYPTVARRAVPMTDLIEVGTYDTQTKRFSLFPTEEATAALAKWKEVT
jgi:hypothetical protein